MTELQMAMILAQTCWPGTSITEGAYEIMRQVRKTHPDQFRETDDKTSTDQAR
jgi:hypothetical protein